MAHSANEHNDEENNILLSSQKLSSSDRNPEPGLLNPDNVHLVRLSGGDLLDQIADGNRSPGQAPTIYPTLSTGVMRKNGPQLFLCHALHSYPQCLPRWSRQR